MALEPVVKKIKAKEVKNITSKNQIECKLDILEDEIKNVCFTKANATLTSLECGDNEVKYFGKAVFAIVLNGDGLKKQEAGVEFSYKIEANGVKNNDEILASVKVENVKISLQNGIPTVFATVVFNGNVIVYNETDYIGNVDGVNCKVEEGEYSVLVQKSKKDFSIEDEFTADYLVNNVYSHFENVKIQEISSGIGCAVIIGELEVVMLIEKGVDKQLIVEKRAIPFRFEHDIERAMPDSIICCNLDVLDTNIKVFVDEAKGFSTISILNSVKLTSLVYENQKFSYLTDCYKADKYISFEKENKIITKEIGLIILNENVKCDKNVKLYENTLLVCPLFVKIEKIDVETIENESFVKGVVHVGFLTKTEDGYSLQTELVPFEIKVDTLNKIEVLNVSANSLTLKEDNGILIEFNLSIVISERETKTISLINALIEGEDKKVNNSAISVYIPNKGDTLWDISKCLGVSEDDVLRTNKNLEFPLTGEERIVIYRELKK